MTRPKFSTLLLLIALFSPCCNSYAHHFKGLPHFSYFENYPQVPTEEFLGQEGEYEFSLVLYDFQGIQKEDAEQPDNARFYLIIFNLRDNRTYNGPLTLEILDGDHLVYMEKMESSHEESLYSMQQTLSENGKYALRITLHEIDDLQTTIPFLLTSQKIYWGKWLVGVLLVLISVVAIGSRKARIMQDRKDNVKLKRQRS